MNDTPLIPLNTLSIDFTIIGSQNTGRFDRLWYLVDIEWLCLLLIFNKTFVIWLPIGNDGLLTNGHLIYRLDIVCLYSDL